MTTPNVQNTPTRKGVPTELNELRRLIKHEMLELLKWDPEIALALGPALMNNGDDFFHRLSARLSKRG